jgi:hypothetical protein
MMQRPSHRLSLLLAFFHGKLPFEIMAELGFDTVIDVPVVRSDSLDSRSFFLELQVAKPSKKTEPQLLTDTRNSNQSPTPAGSIKKEIWHSQRGNWHSKSSRNSGWGGERDLGIISRKNC